jgi:hypothetical protein
MIRRHDWLERLHAFLADPVNATFEWGRNDCVLFAAHCVEELTGEDPLAGVQADWTDEASAKAALDIYGGLRAATITALGAPMENPLFAQRGDVVLTVVRDREFLAIHMGDRLVAPGLDGWAYMSIKHAQWVWSTGR